MNNVFTNYVSELPILMDRLRCSNALTEVEIANTALPGVYCFLENGRPLYLGRTKNFRKRHKNHCGASSSHNSAAFAFVLARDLTNRLRPSYQTVGSRKDLMRNPEFATAFRLAKNGIRLMDVKFVSIPDHNLQHLFELYASLELQTPYNRFETT